MKDFIRCWLVTLLLLAPVVSAKATGCRAVRIRNNVVVQKQVVAIAAAVAVVTPVVATFIPVAVPLYSTVYSPAPAYSGGANYAPQAQQANHCDDLTAAVKQLITYAKQQEARLQRLESGGKVPIMPPADPPIMGGGIPDPFAPKPQEQGTDALTPLLTQNCASCHDASRAVSAGKGFVLTSGGKAVQLSADDLGKTLEAITSKTMPKGKVMSDTDRLSLVTLLLRTPTK